MLRLVEEASGELLDNLLDAVPAGLEQKLDSALSTVQLEVLAEATRNPKVADALRAADARARKRLRELLAGERGTLRHCDGAEIESRIEVLLALFGGMPIRRLMNPGLKRDALIAAIRPVVRTVLT